MSILIVGSEGSMGKRYQAILRYLEKSFVTADKHTSEKDLEKMAEVSDGIIISTPTETHLKMIESMSRFKKPLLCEKPITKNINELNDIRYILHMNHAPFRMMYQYSMLVDKKWNGISQYDYFRHGNDGLVWDCIQIIGLANGPVLLDEKSPIWSCTINKHTLNLSDMDRAYIQYVNLWLIDPNQSFNEIEDIHKKTDEMAKRMLWQVEG